LYALATANVDLSKFSHLLLAMEVQAAQVYWHMSKDDIYDGVFATNRMVGNIGALDVTASTWFGSELEYVHGINIMPVTPVTAILFDQQYVLSQVRRIRAYNTRACAMNSSTTHAVFCVLCLRAVSGVGGAPAAPGAAGQPDVRQQRRVRGRGHAGAMLPDAGGRDACVLRRCRQRTGEDAGMS